MILGIVHIQLRGSMHIWIPGIFLLLRLLFKSILITTYVNYSLNQRFGLLPLLICLSHVWTYAIISFTRGSRSPPTWRSELYGLWNMFLPLHPYRKRWKSLSQPAYRGPYEMKDHGFKFFLGRNWMDIILLCWKISVRSNLLLITLQQTS